MNQEHIGKLIKEIRTKENLSQQKFAEKYGVTYQAVSKWENGKNIPDIIILKQICNDYNINLDDFLDAKVTNKKNKKYKIAIPILIILILIVIILLLFIILSKNNHFEFKTLSTDCDDFNLYGSLAYNDNKSSIYISNITYCGGDDNNNYKEIHCTLYESNNKIKEEISNCSYKNNETITLDEFLKTVDINVDNYSKNCKSYNENSLYLEIEATDLNNKTIKYKIPLNLSENCAN